jgi:hypothetical protein
MIITFGLFIQQSGNPGKFVYLRIKQPEISQERKR